MVRQDILTGLRNALERGYSLEQAQKTLFNSGYSARDINEATRFLAGGLTNHEMKNYIQPQQANQIGNISTNDEEPKKQIQQLSQYSVQKQIPSYHEHSSAGFWILFVILILLLFSLIGLLITIFFQKDKVITLFQSLFP